MTWRRKEEWVKEGKHFRVSVVHWYTDEFHGETFYYPRKEKWNIYLYFYKNHPFFDKFTSEDIYAHEQPEPVGLHGGITFYRAHKDKKNEIICHEIGCDYGHYRDDRFETMVTKEDAEEIFCDAEYAFEILQNMSNVEPS